MPVAIIGSFLTRYWKLILPGLLVLAFAIGHFVDLRTIKDLRVQVAKLERTIGELTGRIQSDAQKLAQRDGLIKVQNDAVVQMATKSLEDEKAYKARLDQANAKAARLQSAIDRAKSFQASNPADPAVTQTELLTMIRETVREYQKERNDVR